jgi:hypothetical protein
VQAPRQDQQHHARSHGSYAVQEMNSRNGLKAERFTIGTLAQGTPDFKASSKLHVWPPLTLALGEFGAGKHCVIGANPCTRSGL